MLNRNMFGRKTSNSFLNQQHYTRLMQIRNLVHHHIVCVCVGGGGNPALLHRHPAHTHTSGPFYQVQCVRNRSDTDGASASKIHSEETNTGVRSADVPAGSKSLHFSVMAKSSTSVGDKNRRQNGGILTEVNK